VPGSGLADYQAFIKAFPRRTTTATAARANTLIVEKLDGKTVSDYP
jgi:hypothetical protein